jgi:hypothetical protein
MEAGTPLNDRPITSELGCVTPFIVVPGTWTDADLDYQAEIVASAVYNNASCNCNAAKVLVTSAAWPQRQTFLDRVAAVLATLPPRRSYYPGAIERYEKFKAAHANSIVCGSTGDSDAVPFVMFSGLDSTNPDELSFTTEPFCAVLSETALEWNNEKGTDTAATFLPRAVEFCNNRLFGTLSVSMLVKQGDTDTDAAVEVALRDLKYGAIGVNIWSATSYAMASTTWGAYPGHPKNDIQSGTGTVHNVFGLPSPVKSIIRAPIRMAPKPPFLATHRHAHDVGRKMVRMEAWPSLWRLPSIAFSAMRT